MPITIMQFVRRAAGGPALLLCLWMGPDDLIAERGEEGRPTRQEKRFRVQRMPDYQTRAILKVWENSCLLSLQDHLTSLKSMIRRLQPFSLTMYVVVEDVISNGLHARARVNLCFITTTIFSSNSRGHPPICQPWCLFWPLVANALSHIKGQAAKSSRRVCAFPMTSQVKTPLTKVGVRIVAHIQCRLTSPTKFLLKSAKRRHYFSLSTFGWLQVLLLKLCSCFCP